MFADPCVLGNTNGCLVSLRSSHICKWLSECLQERISIISEVNVWAVLCTACWLEARSGAECMASTGDVIESGPVGCSQRRALPSGAFTADPSGLGAFHARPAWCPGLTQWGSPASWWTLGHCHRQAPLPTCCQGWPPETVSCWFVVASGECYIRAMLCLFYSIPLIIYLLLLPYAVLDNQWIVQCEKVLK